MTPTTQTSRETSSDRGVRPMNDMTIQAGFDHVLHTSSSPHQDVGAPPSIPAAFIPSSESISQAGLRLQPPDLPQKFQGFLYQQAQQNFPAQNGAPVTSQNYPYPMAVYPTYSSRIEDVRMAPQGQPQSNRSEYISSQVQSHYTVARQDNVCGEIR